MRILPANFPPLPFAELHVHIEGTLGNPLVFELAERNKINLPFSSAEELSSLCKYQNLQQFLDLYFACMNVLQTEDDFYDLMINYLSHAPENNILRSEIFFDPQAHTSRGIPFETVANGLLAGMNDGGKRFGVSSELIMNFLRHMSADSAMETLESAIPYHDRIIGVGLDSKEIGNPPSKFKPVFKRAKKEGFHRRTAHAGEEAHPNYIWEALDLLGVDRGDHCYTALRDRRLMRRFLRKQIPMTWCPFAAVAVQYYKSIETIALDMKMLLDDGYCLSCHSDDPAYFGGYLLDNLVAVHQAGNFTHRHIYKLSRNSFAGAWISKTERQRYMRIVDQTYTNWRAAHPVA